MPPQPYNTAATPTPYPSTPTLYATENNNFPRFIIIIFLETHFLPFIKNYISDIGLESHTSAPHVF